MKWNVEAISNVSRRLTVDIPVDAVDSKLSETWRKVGKQVTVKGFRPGKAPIGMLKRQHSERVHAQVQDELIDTTVGQALQEADLEPIANFEVERGTVSPGEAYQYTVSFEVMALPENVQFKGLDLKRTRVEVADAEIDARLESMREQHAELIPVEDRGAETDHILTVDYQGYVNDTPVEGAKGDEQEIQLGSPHLLPGFTKGLLGVKPGEERVVHLEAPAPRGSDPDAAQPTTFLVNVTKIMEKEFPALDDEFAVDMGHADLSTLKASIQSDLEGDQKRHADHGVREQLVRQLTEKNAFDVPEPMVQSRARELMHNFGQQLAGQGLSLDALGSNPEEQLKNFTERAELLCKERILVAAIAEQEKIAISDEALEAHVVEMGTRMERDVDEIRPLLLEGAARPQVVAQLLGERVCSYVEDAANVEMVDPAPAENPEEGFDEGADDDIDEDATTTTEASE
jgi:trigger factor